MNRKVISFLILFHATFAFDNDRCDIKNTDFRSSTKFNCPGSGPIYELRILNSNMPHISSAICEEFPCLEILRVEASKVQTIADDAFQGCKNLTKIDLTNNHISYLHPDTFSCNLNLDGVYLGRNKLEKIDLELFRELKHLSEVDLSLNLLRSFPVEALDDTEHLSYLNLFGNKLLDLDVEELFEKHEFCELEVGDNFFFCERTKSIKQAFIKYFHKAPEVKQAVNRKGARVYNDDKLLCLPDNILSPEDKLCCDEGSATTIPDWLYILFIIFSVILFLLLIFLIVVSVYNYCHYRRVSQDEGN